MSGIVKSVKKVFKKITKPIKKVFKAVGKGLKKVMKSKLFKGLLIGAAVFFGGAGIASMASGGSFATGVGSAWGTLSSAGSSLLSGNLGTAASTFGNVWSTAGAAGAAQASGAIAGGLSAGASFAGVGGSASTAVSSTLGATQAGYTGQAMQNFVATNAGAATPAISAGASTGTMASIAPNAGDALLASHGGGLMGGAGAAAKAGAAAAPAMSTGKAMLYGAAINAGTQMIGGYMSAKAQEEAEEEALERRRQNMSDRQVNFTTDNLGLMNPARSPINSGNSRLRQFMDYQYTPPIGNA